MRTRVAVVGATGYTGSESLRYLLGHPSVDVVAAVARSAAGSPLSHAVPALTGRTDLVCEPYDGPALAGRADAALLCLPHGEAQDVAHELLGAGVTVVDLSADHRMGDAALHEQVYGPHRHPERLGEAVYGAPELFRESIRGARLIAAPGCYPTSANLALWPLLRADLVDPADLIVDAKSGVSGAGRAPTDAAHFPECGEGVTAYKVLTHRHGPEIERALGAASGRRVRVLFTPHLVPMSRGILCTAYARLRPGATATDVRRAYEAAYQDEPFVHLLPGDRTPRTQDVRGSGHAHVQCYVRPDDGRVVAVSAIDNLGKGAAAQAVQCLNIARGLPEDAGLGAAPLCP